MSVIEAAPEPAEFGEAVHKDSLHAGLADTRRFSLKLVEPLSDEDQVVQSMDDASPAKWHLAHTTWFFEELVLKPFADDYRVLDERYGYCFNSYYESVGPRHPRPKRGLLTRPSAQEVRAYRMHVDEALDRLFAAYDGDPPKDVADLITLGINHEQQHQELLLTDILSLFAANPLRPAYRTARGRLESGSPPDMQWIGFGGGLLEAGHCGDGFAYDNECPRHEVLVRPFRLASRPVTNGEWLEFMEDGGYDTPALWLADGWTCVCERGWQAPLYWEKSDGERRQMTLQGLLPVDPAAPVSHVSYFEADAFARWSGKRLPSEFEWEIASASAPIEGNMAGTGTLLPLPAEPGRGLSQMFGDVWEWTQSPYSPYPGFEAANGAIGEYNGKFMCNQFVLKGGSCATPDGHIRRTYRNFFYPFQQWQFMGLRLAESA